MSDKVIITLIETIENPFLLTFIFIFLIMALILKGRVNTLFNRFLNNIANKSNDRKISEFIHHDVFNTLNTVVYEVKLQQYYTKGEYDSVKTKMCYDFVSKKSSVCRAHMVELIKRKDIDTMRVDRLKNVILTAQNRMHSEYITRITDLWLQKKIEKEDVDYIVFQFEKFRYDVVNSFSHRIEAIFSSSFHKTNYDRVLAVFDMWAMGIDLLPKDMKVTFENLNGKFKDIDY